MPYSTPRALSTFPPSLSVSVSLYRVIVCPGPVSSAAGSVTSRRTPSVSWYQPVLRVESVPSGAR